LEIPSKRKIRDIHVHTRSQLCPRRAKEYNGPDQCTATRPCRDCKITLHWQTKGEYLAVKMCRRKTKKQVSTSYHIVRLGDAALNVEKDKKSNENVLGESKIPVEVLDIDEPVIAFAWEPAAKRFGVVHGEGNRTTVKFYELKNQKLKLLVTLSDRPCNCLFWSPRGNLVILAGLGALNGVLEFYDVNNKETIALLEHYMCTDVEWDPSGRFVISSVIQPLRNEGVYRYNTENGYKLWTMHGQILSTVRLESCYQVLWRPRPPRLFSAEEEKEIKKKCKGKILGSIPKRR